MTQTIDAILEDYRDSGCTAFVIYQGKERKKAYEGDDIEEGAELLQKYLSRPQTGILKIKVYKTVPKNGIDNKTIEYETYDFQRQ